ncbi:phosphodiesterase [Lewinellaceae bacterium SD302]|nr:phosphodiesterase [Lewinellaceae bacterium SD302]
MKPTLLAILLVFTTLLSAQRELLQSGPMLGYAEMREILIWVQTTEAATVRIGYFPVAAGPENTRFTASIATLPATAFTAKLLADQVEPGIEYNYQLYINDQPIKLDYPTTFTTPPVWRWRNDPPEFSVAMGSCTYINDVPYDRPGKGYGSEYEIFTSIDAKQPNLMLWLGDNTYLREPDWYSRTGVFHRYTHTRSVPEMQPLLARTHNYATWDDHDFGPNNSDRTWVRKELTTEAFELFWGNLTFGTPDFGGITSMFRYNDVDFFLLDNRSFRSPNDLKHGEKTVLGKAQLEWLIESLVFSDASYKMVCIGGQVLNTHQGGETYARLAPLEREYLLKRIEEEGIKNVVFLTGDRHHTELSELTLRNGEKIYDITISSLTAGTGSERSEINKNRVDGTLTIQHNFGVLTFTGAFRERALKLEVFDKDGLLLWERDL